MELMLKLKLTAGIFLIFMLHGAKSDTKNIEIEKAQIMPQSDSSQIDFGTLRLTKAANRRDLTVSGTIYILKDLEEPEIGLGYSLYRKNPVTKKFTASPMIHTQRPICEAIEKEPLFYPDLIHVSNLPQPGVCPFPKGNYTINNYIFAEDKYRKFPPGEYKLIGIFSKNKKFMTGYEFYATLT